MSLPVVTIIGTINKIETKFTAGGKQVTSFQVECSEKNTKGEWENLYIKGAVFEKSAEFVNQYFKDGDVCIANGKLITEVYENKDGKKVYDIKLKFPQISFAPKSKNSTDKAPRVDYYSNDGKKITEKDFSNTDFDVSDEQIPF